MKMASSHALLVDIMLNDLSLPWDLLLSRRGIAVYNTYFTPHVTDNKFIQSLSKVMHSEVFSCLI